MQQRRFQNIDALRGIAALFVIWLHAAEVFVTLPSVSVRGTAIHDAADLLGLGRMGVVAFFAVSGYVLVPTVRGPRMKGTIDFLIKRFFRLFPPFWFAIGTAALTVWWLFGHRLTWPIVAANFTMIPLEFGEPQMMGHFWTLEVELIFYAIVLVLFWTGRLDREDLIARGLVVLSILWPIVFKTKWGRALVDHNEVWTFLSYFLTVMFWGASLRKRHDRTASHDSSPWRRDWPMWLMTALVLARPLIAITFGSPTVNREDWRGTLLGLILFWVTIRSPSWSGRPFVWLGTISYSLYLLHPAVFYPVFYLVSHDPRLSTGPLASYVVASMIASIVCAALAYRFVERPSMRIGQRWLARYQDWRIIR